MFKKNVHTVERIARMVIGALLMAGAGAGLLGLWAWIGIIPVLTGLFGSCPLYTVLGVNTCSNNSPKA